MYRVEGWLVDAGVERIAGRYLQESEEVLSDAEVGDEWPAPAKKSVYSYWVVDDR